MRRDGCGSTDLLGRSRKTGNAALMRYQPPHELIAKLAFQLYEDYGAAGFELDADTIWYEALAILRGCYYAAQGKQRVTV